MADKKIYIGSGKAKHPEWLKCSISKKGIETLLANLTEFPEGNFFAKVDINILKEPNKYGKDVEIVLDTYKHPNDRGTVAQEIQTVQSEPENESIDLPF